MSGKFKYRLFLLVIICLATTKNTILAQDREQDSTSTSSSFLSSKVHYFATDSSQIDIQNKKVFLYHQAQVNYEDIELQAEDGIRDLVRSRGLGDVYKRQLVLYSIPVWSYLFSSEYSLGPVSYTHLTLPTTERV